MRNKIIFLAMALLSFAYTSKAESVKIDDFTITAGETATVTLDLTNTRTDLTAFSLTLQLPEGITLVEAVATDRYTGQIVVGNPAPNEYNICGIQLGLETITGKSGALVTLTLKAADNVKPGEYTGTISDVDFITTARQHVRPVNSTFKVTVEKGTAALLGDANDDGLINMSDVSTIINYVLGKNPTPFSFINADCTGDGLINMSDVTSIINIILGK
ncbi:MAG: dockerin type I repeat-containing protein [Prevotella sp.]|nr:dockerin type I repeat-containing protein [Prevotella sp.]